MGGETLTGTPREFSRIIGYAATRDGASHLNSATDVVLGSLGYCINHRGADADSTRDMFEALVPLLNYDSKARGNASPYAGLIFSPAEVRSAKYQRDYDELAKHLRGLEPHFDLEDW